MLNEVLTEESLLNICLDNIAADLSSSDECYKYVTAYVMFKNPELDEEDIPEKVRDLVADKIISNLISKDMVEYDFDSGMYNVTESGQEYFKENLNVGL